MIVIDAKIHWAHYIIEFKKLDSSTAIQYESVTPVIVADANTEETFGPGVKITI